MSDFQAKLQHLTAEQVEALYSEYISGEKIAHLLERYAIDVAPSSLIKAFPPLPCAALRCPYCKTSLFERRKSRTASSCHENMAFCKTCEHRHYFPGRTQWRRDCACQPCLAARQQARLELQAQQRQRIREHWSLARRRPIPLRSLSITRKLQLLALLEVRMDKQLDRLLPAEHPTGDECLSPSKTMDANLLQALQEDLILLVDPDSPPVCFSNDPTPKAWRDKVYWVVNVSLHGHQRARLTPLHRALLELLGAGPRPEWREELSEAITTLAIEEVFACIASRCAAHGLPFEASAKAERVVAQLLGMLPVASAWSLVDGAVHGALAYRARSHVTPLHASSTIPANMLAAAERAVREQWQFSPCSYASNAVLNHYSRVLFDVLLRQADHGLRRRIAEYIEQLPCRGA
ncbi:Uncharacterised protein [Pseudomonas putida]|uniref:Uncharacterized protein n=1 Tax=Pseudomonas putida TaxID=303 RepID=A0A379KPT9_PSEPU|nr:hypothetical protein [Pseudomonas putida]SUD70043.1 Uncharacterised protein [Pseudomonas putida]